MDARVKPGHDSGESQRSAARILCGAGYAVFHLLPPRKSEGMARQAARHAVKSRAVAGTWRLSARHGGVFAAPGRAFGSALGVPFGCSGASSPHRLVAPSHLLDRPSRSPSASSSQAASRPPGGTPALPGRGRSVRLPRAGAASDPANMTPHDSALPGHDTRALQAYLGHRNIQHTVRYTELSPTRFKDFWRE